MTACTCGCSTMTAITNAAEPCACGCECCAAEPSTREEEIAELRSLRDAAERRLAELDAG